MKKCRPWTTVDQNLLKAYVSYRWPLKDAAAKLRRTIPAVRAKMYELNIRLGWTIPEHRKQKMWLAFKQGRRVSDIAFDFDCSERTVQRAIRKYRTEKTPA